MLLSHLKAKQCHDATVIKLMHMHMWVTMAEVCVGSEYTEVEVISTYKWQWYHAEHKHNTLTSEKI